MLIEFDPAKDAHNIAKHGVSLADAKRFEWETAVLWLDTRADYGEEREIALGFIDPHLYHMAFVERDEVCRVISLRKATNQERIEYAKAFNAS